MRPTSILLTALFVLAVSSPAFALSIDRESGMNEDGTAKFSDPDDQQPQGLLNTPPADPSQQGPANGMMPVSPDARFGVMVNHFGSEPTQDAFEQSYDRK